jgi:hypothetical protein
MDALAHQYLQDRDQVRSQEYDRCVLQHLVPLDVHLQEDDPRQELHPDDQEEGELVDRYPEVAVLDDHLDPIAVAAKDEEQTAQEPYLKKVLEEFAEQHRFAVSEPKLEQVLVQALM